MNFRGNRREELGLDITPLIDVVFILLIFFMVSTTFQKQSQLQIQLPEAEQASQNEPADPLVIFISAAGQYAVGQQELSDNQRSTLIDALARAVDGNRERPLVIRADANTPHQAVVRAMDAAAQLGLNRLAIATAQDHGE